MSKKQIKVMDTSFRDGFQSVYGARVFTKDFLPALESAVAAGLKHFEVGGGARFQSPIFYCNENAFDMMDTIRKTVGPDINLQTLARGVNVVGLDSQPRDIINLHAKMFKKHGMTTIRNFDALNDVNNLIYSGQCIKDNGLKHEVTITMMELPIGCTGAHDVAFYERVLRNILDAGIPFDSLAFKDASGTSAPRKVYETIKRTREILGPDMHIRFHSHETAGTGLAAYMAALDGGADGIDLSMKPVSGGTAQPDIVSMWHALKGSEYDLGIDVEKIKQRAVEKGLFTQAEIDNLPEEQVVNLIFYPGFSTGDTVTELSGRGLGLDIVHTKISQLNGRIDVYSELNKGTLVTMELPTTMATLRTFIIMEQGQLYALPASSIQTVLRIDPNDVFIRDGKNHYIHNGEVIQVYTLSQILELENKPRETEKYTLVIVESENSRLGIIIEKLIGDQEILHKKLSPPLFRVKNIAGITTLASGEMCLILNMTDILNTTLSRKASTNIIPSTRVRALEANAKKKIFVLDDSLTTRTLQKSILMNCGYQVEVCGNPKEALKLLENDIFDLIVTDHEMPHLSGMEFVKELRKQKKYASTPVIVLTSVKEHITNKIYADVDVQDFIRKDDFEQRKFLSLINKYLGEK